MKAILFEIQDAVTIAGQPIKATCYIRVKEDLKNATILKKLTHKCSSKNIQRSKIYFNAFTRHNIPDTEILKDEVANVSMESFAEPHKKYQLVEDNFTRVQRKYGKAPKYEKQFEIHSGPLKRGDYQYDASINTLESFPSSFLFKSGNRKKLASVSYKLQIIVLDHQEIYHQASTDIYINRQQIPRPIKQTTEGNIIQCICFPLNRGTVELTISLDKNVFEPGERFILSYTLDNTRSQRAIERIEVRVITRLTMIDQSYEENKVQEIVQINSYKGVRPGITGIFEKKIELPADVRPTINTEFIRHCVFLQIEAIPDAFFSFASVPTLIQVPIIIKVTKVRRQVPNLDGWKLPKFRNPQIITITGAEYLSSGVPLLANSQMTLQTQGFIGPSLKQLPNIQDSDSYIPLKTLPEIEYSESSIHNINEQIRQNGQSYIPLKKVPNNEESYITLPKIEYSASSIPDTNQQKIEQIDAQKSYIKLPNFFLEGSSQH